MRKIVVEKMVLEVGEVISLEKVKPILGNSAMRHKAPTLETAKKAVVYRVKECKGTRTNKNYYLYYMITDTGRQIQLNESEVGECSVIESLNFSDFFQDIDEIGGNGS